MVPKIQEKGFSSATRYVLDEELAGTDYYSRHHSYYFWCRQAAGNRRRHGKGH